MPIECRTLAGATQFDGLTPATGLFDFKTFNNLQRSTRISILTLSYTEAMDAVPLTTSVEFHAVRPAGNATERIILGRGVAAVGLLSPVTGDAELKLCGIVLPRDKGDGGSFWRIEAVTTDKTEDGTVCCDYVICPFPETDQRDSTE